MAIERRVRNQRGEGERLHTALLNAAGELLADARDVDELSVRAVTARAGVSPTALYLHFADKDDLIRAVKVRSFAALGEAIAAAQAEADDDPREQLRAGCLAYLRFAREQPGTYAILFHTQNMPPKRRRGGSSGAGMDVFQTLVRGVAGVVGDDQNAFDLACVLWMALHGRAVVAFAMPHFPFPDAERFVALLVDELRSSVLQNTRRKGRSRGKRTV